MYRFGNCVYIAILHKIPLVPYLEVEWLKSCTKSHMAGRKYVHPDAITHNPPVSFLEGGCSGQYNRSPFNFIPQYVIKYSQVVKPSNMNSRALHV